MQATNSFQIYRKGVNPGIYVSRKDLVGNHCITTFDLRFMRPNEEMPMSTAGIHTIEHIGSIYLRSLSSFADRVIYFGPMGCRTGFCLILNGNFQSDDISTDIIKMCNFIIMHHGQVPGASEKECGNYLDHSSEDARLYAITYGDRLRNEPCYIA